MKKASLLVRPHLLNVGIVLGGNVNYQKIYARLIDSALSKKCPDAYYERHHIIPKSMGGTDDVANIARLTAREHFIAHVLLAKIYGGNQWFAVTRMAKQTKQLHSKLYAVARIEHAKAASIALTGKKVHTQEFKDRLQAQYTGRLLAIDVKEKISIALKGRSAWNKDRQLSKCHKKNVGSAMRNKPWSVLRRFQHVRRITLTNWELHV
jgi:5-methylcytosine-specific restriction endonuclease McrA